MTLLGATIPDQSGPESDGSEGIFHIPQSSIITGASPSDCLRSYQGDTLEESYLSVKNQSVYSTADWTELVRYCVKTIADQLSFLKNINIFFSINMLVTMSLPSMEDEKTLPHHL